MTDWNDFARRLQFGVQSDEREANAEYSDDEVRRAIVHSRQDIVLLVAHLSSLNRQIETIKIAVIVLLMIAIAAGAAVLWDYLPVIMHFANASTR